MFEQILAGLFLVTKRTTEQMCQVSLKCMEPNAKGSDLKIASFLAFSSKCRFLKFKAHFLQGIMGKS